MEYLGEKIIKLQDAKFKMLQNNSNEASIFISGDLAEKLKLVENSKAKFKIEKSDLIKLLCFTFSFKGTIYKKEKITLDLNWFDKYLTLINKHYENGSEFSFDVKKQSQERFYFIGIEQTSGLNVRDLFIQDHIKLLFYKGETDLMKIECSIEKYQEIESDKYKNFAIEDNVLRQFALKSLRYIISKYGESFIIRSNINVTESVTSDSIPYKTFLFPDYFTQGLLFSFESEPNKNYSRSTPRFINENLNILGQNFIYLTTEWAYSGTSNLLFSQLVKFIEEFTNSEYTAIRNGENGPFLLIKKLSQSNLLFDFQEKSKAAGLIFSNQLIQRFVASLCAKPFVICSGLSGSGKTKLAQAFAQWITVNESQYVIVPVGADWTNREPLLGYPNSLKKEEYVTPENGVLDLMVRAKQNIENTEEPTKPYFLILDEMNLSHVERYFADFLSTMESGDTIPLHNILPEPRKDLITIPQKLKLPKNLFIIGTVNIDETTYMFSPKVLDRANTIEFRLTEKDLADFIASDMKLDMDLLKAQGSNLSDGFMAIALQETNINLKPTEDDLKLFFSELKKSGAEFGFRTASEIGRLMYMLKELGEDGDNLLDIAIMQKLLPKLHGSRNKLTKVLPILGGFCLTDNAKIKEDYLDKFVNNSLTEVELKADPNIKYKISFEKICRMYRNAVENGFASYAEA